MERMEFDLRETGRGPAILMLPGSFATPAAWKGIMNALTSHFRILSTSLPGYGTTPEIRPDNDASIGRMVEFVGQVVDEVGEPVHVVGHSWGAQLALAAVLAERINPLSVLCFEANPIFAQTGHGPFSWRPDIEEMIDRFEKALAAGNPDAASMIIDFYSRPGTFQSMPENVRAFCRATAPNNLRDWHTAASFTPSFEDFATIEIPVTLVRGEQTPTPIIDVNRELAANIPGVNERVVAGADHFLISTHPAACAELLEAHMYDVSR